MKKVLAGDWNANASATAKHRSKPPTRRQADAEWSQRIKRSGFKQKPQLAGAFHFPLQPARGKQNQNRSETLKGDEK